MINQFLLDQVSEHFPLYLCLMNNQMSPEVHQQGKSPFNCSLYRSGVHRVHYKLKEKLIEWSKRTGCSGSLVKWSINGRLPSCLVTLAWLLIIILQFSIPSLHPIVSIHCSIMCISWDPGGCQEVGSLIALYCNIQVMISTTM